MRRISTRLAVSFLLVALLPTMPLSLVVRDLLERRFGPAIADPLETALDAGLAESRAHLQELRDLLQVRAAAAGGRRTRPLVLLDGLGRVQPADSLAAFLAARPDLAARAAALPRRRGRAGGRARTLRRRAGHGGGASGRRPAVVLQPLPDGHGGPGPRPDRRPGPAAGGPRRAGPRGPQLRGAVPAGVRAC